jgi:hypothetical protein
LHGHNKCSGILNYVVFLIVGVRTKIQKILTDLPIHATPPCLLYSSPICVVPMVPILVSSPECLSSEFASNSWQEDVADCCGVSYMSHALYSQTWYLIYVSHMDRICPMKFDLKIYIGELHITSSSSLFSNFKISQVHVTRA